MYKRIIGIASAAVIVLMSCSKSNEAELGAGLPGSRACDTAGARFSTHITPILQANCNSCHTSGFSSGGVSTDNYRGVKMIADNGKLVGSVTHNGTASPMPLGMPKLSACDIDKIKAWVSRGANND